MSHDDDYVDYATPEPGTRTRFAEGDNDARYGAPRRGGRVSPSRAMVTVVSVVVLLIAAIAFANRGGNTQDEDPDTAANPDTNTQPTAPTGDTPAKSSTNGIPTGFPQSAEGAQSAAANYAVALGGDQMFTPEGRHELVDALYTPELAEKTKTGMDAAYSEDFLANLGLDAEGEPPSGMTFISRTVPIGTTVKEYEDGAATVAVWYTGLIGLAGPDSDVPVRTTWHTWTFELQWSDGDWKIAADSQKRGPAPVPGDVPAATDEQIEDAVEQFGGFTYAR
ncbi:hypothetical protein GCM10010400_68090 [Streptomyces aculeolatus]|uniref:hypothetical protein n=1 Tax=Streptomyces aculeolatus TaxID=270689 RepID=UPI001CED6B1B|nr:hypothetical protein [Streptomyces aculeolatus]